MTIVEACSDSLADTGSGEAKLPWRQRKENYIAHLRTAGDDVLAVSLADKVHNAESTLTQVRAGQTLDEIFANFNFGREGQEMNYRGLLAAFKKHSTQNPSLARLVTRLERAIEEIFTP